MLHKSKLCIIIGARPQFIKHAPIELVLKNHFEIVSIHTGQHYDDNMSKIFFEQLQMSKPQYMLSVGSSTHGKQTGQMLDKIEEILIKEQPIAVLVYGDTNSTLAGALAASKLLLPLIHIEAGLRSRNKTMPEEINRIVTDHVSDYLFASSKLSVENLLSEGIPRNKIFLVGDIMYDSLLLAKKVLEKTQASESHILVTLHRPYNTDNIQRLINILSELNSIGHKIIFPIHPRTKDVLIKNSIPYQNFNNITFCEPVSYFELIKLQLESICVITDSGGIQKEAYFLRKKCITLRSETEWVETLENNWNTLIFHDLSLIRNTIKEIPGNYIDGIYGDGNSGKQIADILLEKLQ